MNITDNFKKYIYNSRLTFLFWPTDLITRLMKQSKSTILSTNTNMMNEIESTLLPSQSKLSAISAYNYHRLLHRYERVNDA